MTNTTPPAKIYATTATIGRTMAPDEVLESGDEVWVDGTLMRMTHHMRVSELLAQEGAETCQTVRWV